MANTKITALPEQLTPAGTEFLVIATAPITNEKLQLDNIYAGTLDLDLNGNDILDVLDLTLTNDINMSNFGRIIWSRRQHM